MFSSVPAVKVLNRWTCWFWTVLNWCRSPFTPPVMGHEYIETEAHEDCYVRVFRCRCCDHLSIGWGIRSQPNYEEKGENP